MIDLSKISHIKIGGKTNNYFLPKNVQELKKIIKNEENLFFLGACSNILFSDNIKKFLVIDKNIPQELIIEKNQVICSANWNINSLIMILKNKMLGGIEFLIGVPANLGGIVKMNAGAFGEEISNFISWVQLIDKNGKIYYQKKEEINFKYRSSSIKDYIYKICLNLKEISKENIENNIKKFISERKAKQPLNMPNLGCIFKNPANISAGKLIDDIFPNRLSIGGAKISNLHANFFVNYNKASYSDMQNLIDKVRGKVLLKTKISLDLEIEIIK